MANGTQTLVEGMNFTSKAGFLNSYKKLGDYIVKNLNPKFAIRDYQQEGIGRFIYYLSGLSAEEHSASFIISHGDGLREDAVDGG